MKLRTTIAAGYFTVIGLVAVVGVVGLLGLYQYAGSVENGTAATRLSLALGEVRALEWSALRGDLSASGEARDRLASIVNQFATRGMTAEQASVETGFAAIRRCSGKPLYSLKSLAFLFSAVH